jgi:putative ABC transport system ATP-binding protein/lipoprotein-releasing system ATP-binding protein
MIEVTHLSKSFGNPPTHVIKDLSFQIKSHDFVSIWGRSGSGKTTLLYLISTLDKPTSGEIKIDGFDITKFNSKQLHDFRNQNIGFIFQFHYLLPELTAIENVLLPAFRNHQQIESCNCWSILTRESAPQLS